MIYLPADVGILLAWPCDNVAFACRLFSATDSRTRFWLPRSAVFSKSCSSSASRPEHKPNHLKFTYIYMYFVL